MCYFLFYVTTVSKCWIHGGAFLGIWLLLLAAWNASFCRKQWKIAWNVEDSVFRNFEWQLWCFNISTKLWWQWRWQGDPGDYSAVPERSMFNAPVLVRTWMFQLGLLHLEPKCIGLYSCDFNFRCTDFQEGCFGYLISVIQTHGVPCPFRNVHFTNYFF